MAAKEPRRCLHMSAGKFASHPASRMTLKAPAVGALAGKDRDNTAVRIDDGLGSAGNERYEVHLQRERGKNAPSIPADQLEFNS